MFPFAYFIQICVWPIRSDVRPPYLVIRNFKTMSHFLKITPLFWASEGQNNETKQIRCPNFPSFALVFVKNSLNNIYVDNGNVTNMYVDKEAAEDAAEGQPKCHPKSVLMLHHLEINVVGILYILYNIVNYTCV